jgi:hypothetical protein
MTTGYSGTPLAKKLGLTTGLRIWLVDMPDSVRTEINPAAIGLVECGGPEKGIGAAHLFVTDRAVMANRLATLRPLLAPAGFVWVLILAWSQPWLARFTYGPAEWLWRSLARGQPQPIWRSVQP